MTAFHAVSPSASKSSCGFTRLIHTSLRSEISATIVLILIPDRFSMPNASLARTMSELSCCSLLTLVWKMDSWSSASVGVRSPCVGLLAFHSLTAILILSETDLSHSMIFACSVAIFSDSSSSFLVYI